MSRSREYPHIASVEKYLSTRELSVGEQNRIRVDVGEFLKLLSERGHTLPDKSDYEAFRVYREGKDKTAATIKDRIRRIQKYYEWRQKHPMNEEMKPIEYQEERREEQSTPKEETAHVIAEGIAQIGKSHIDKPKRGRKPKAENVDRVQVSVYLPRSSYEAVKDLASFSKQNISDLLARLAFKFIEKNSQTLDEGRRKIQELQSLNVEI